MKTNKIFKALSLALAILIAAFCFAGCGSEQTDADTTGSDKTVTVKTDMDYIKAKGVLVVGITDFEPMDYKDDAGKWIGFDADMATLFAARLGVKVQFVEIDWDQKATELDGKTIDCVWNGMTLTDEVKTAMATSNAYCNNAQVVIVRADKADQYKTVEDCKDLKFAVEAGSAGKDMAAENKFNFTEVDKQSTALMEVAAKTSDAAIIDSLMAGAMVGEGTGYKDLTYTVSLNSEEYGVGFRKGSDLAAEINNFFKESLENGKTMEIAKKYGVQAAIK